MKRINIEQALRAMGHAVNGDWDTWYREHGMKPARLEMPLGELLNERIQGYVWAWKIKNAITIAPIHERDCFSAQGLEGKAVIMTSLATALLVARELPKYRRAVYA